MKLRELQTFETVKEMDSYISNILETVDLKEGERKLIRLLAGHSCKIVGVSWLKVQTMADALGVTYKTVQRALKRLKELKLVRRVEQYKPVRGGNSSSITLLCPTVMSYRTCEEEPTGSNSQEACEEEETVSFKTSSLKGLRERTQQLDLSYLEGSGVPQEFVQAVKPFIGNAVEVAGLWQRVSHAQKRFFSGEPTEIAVRAFKQTVLASKLGRVRKEFTGYFYGVLSQMFAEEQRRNSKMLDWFSSELVY